MTYHQFQKVVAAMDSPPEPEEPVVLKTLGESITPMAADHNTKYGVPTLEELGG